MDKDRGYASLIPEPLLSALYTYMPMYNIPIGSGLPLSRHSGMPWYIADPVLASGAGWGHPEMPEMSSLPSMDSQSAELTRWHSI